MSLPLDLSDFKTGTRYCRRGGHSRNFHIISEMMLQTLKMESTV